MLPLEEIDPNPRNPRKGVDERSLNELAQSIRELGQLQPIVVRRAGERYELICGERRWRACGRAQLTEVWAVERLADDLEAFKIAFSENVHRQQLTRGEKVAALDELAELSSAVGVRRTATLLGMSHGWLIAQLQMRQDPDIFPALDEGQINFQQADALRRAPAALRRAFVVRAIQERTQPAELRRWVDEAKHHRAVSVSTGSPIEPSTDPIETALALLRLAGAPSSSQREALGEIVRIASGLLSVPQEEPGKRRTKAPSSRARAA
jgi:hypothetical protein